MARVFDASTTIIVSEPAFIRRKFALDHGATLALDPLQTDVVNATLVATDGAGVDIAFDAAGIQASIDTALRSVRPRGMVLNVAIWEQTPKVDINLVLMREINLTGELTAWTIYVMF